VLRRLILVPAVGAFLGKRGVGKRGLKRGKKKHPLVMAGILVKSGKKLVGGKEDPAPGGGRRNIRTENLAQGKGCLGQKVGA